MYFCPNTMIYSAVLHMLTIWVTPRVFCGRKGLLSLRWRLGTPPFFGGVRVTHLFSFLCCVICLICLRPVCCVHNVPSFSGLSILIVPSVFSNVYLFSLFLSCVLYTQCSQFLKIVYSWLSLRFSPIYYIYIRFITLRGSWTEDRI